MSGERANLTAQSLPSLHLHAIAKLISKILEQDNFDFIKIEQSDRQFRVRFDAHRIVKEVTKKEYYGKLRQVFRDINESICLSTNESQPKTLSEYITKIQGQILEELNKQTKIKTGQEFKEFITDNEIIRTLEDYANLEDGDYILSIKPKNGKKKDEPSAIANFSHNIQEIGVTSASSDRRLGNVVQAQFETDRAETRDRIIDACLQYLSKRFKPLDDDEDWNDIQEMLQEERDENCNKLGFSDLLKILREKVWSQIANFATLKYFDFIKTTLSPKDKKRLEYDEFLKFIKRLEETVTYLENLLDRDEEKEVKFGQASVPLRRLFAESNYLQKYLPVSPTLEGVYAQGENKNRHLVRYGYKIKLNGAVQKHKCASSYEYSLKVISGKIQPSKFPTNNTYNRITRLILLGLVFLPDPTWLKEKLEQVENSPDLKKEIDRVVSGLTQRQPDVNRLVAFLEDVAIKSQDKKNQSHRYDFTLQLSSSVLNRNILGASEISEVANSLGFGNLFHEDIQSSIYRNSAALRFLTVKSSKDKAVNEPLLQLDGQVIFTVKTLEKIEQEDRFNCKVAWDRGKTRESLTIPVFVGSKNIVENVDEQTQEWVKKQFTIEGLFLSINALDRADGQVENEIQLSGFIVYATLAAIFVHTVRNILKGKPVILPLISFLSTPQSKTSDADELTKIIVDCISYLSQNYKTRNDITRSVSQGIVTKIKTSLQMRVNNAKSSIYSKDILPRIFENVSVESDKFKKMAVVFITSTACDRKLNSKDSDEEKILLGMNIVSIHQPNMKKEQVKRVILINSIKNIATVIHKEQRHRPIADEIFKLHMQNNFEEIVLISRPSFHQIWNTGKSSMDTQKPYFYTDELIERVRTDIMKDNQENSEIDNKKKLFLYFTYTEKIPTVLDPKTKKQDVKEGLSYWMLSLDDLELLNPAVDLSASFLGIFNGISIEERGKAKSRKNYNYALLYSTARNLQDIDELVTLLGKREEFQKERKALLTNLLLLHLADNEKYEFYKKRALKIDPYSRTVDAIKKSVFEVKYKADGKPVPVDFKFNFMAYLSMIFSILNKENLYG